MRYIKLLVIGVGAVALMPLAQALAHDNQTSLIGYREHQKVKTATRTTSSLSRAQTADTVLDKETKEIDKEDTDENLEVHKENSIKPIKDQVHHKLRSTIVSPPRFRD